MKPTFGGTEVQEAPTSKHRWVRIGEATVVEQLVPWEFVVLYLALGVGVTVQ